MPKRDFIKINKKLHEFHINVKKKKFEFARGIVNIQKETREIYEQIAEKHNVRVSDVHKIVASRFAYTQELIRSTNLITDNVDEIPSIRLYKLGVFYLKPKIKNALQYEDFRQNLMENKITYNKYKLLKLKKDGIKNSTNETEQSSIDSNS